MQSVAARVQSEATSPLDVQYFVQYFTVRPAVSTKNIFGKLPPLPQNPGLGPNNWSSPHQDSYCSESVGLTGPTSGNLKLILKKNPYGYTPIMVCNKNDQMIGMSVSTKTGIFHVIVFDSDCNILAATPVNNFNLHNLKSLSFSGGYFYQDQNENTIANYFDNRIASLPTSNVENKGEIYKLNPNWISCNIVELVTGSSKNNRLYSTMPVWDESSPNLYWCLLSGNYDIDKKELFSSAYMAVVQIIPDGNGGAETTLMDFYELTDQWNNNTFAVDEDGAYFVTNGVDSSGVSNQGYCWALGYNTSTQKICLRWSTPYENSGLLKTGQENIGSGTTPTLLSSGGSSRCVAITDNAYPQMNVVVYDRSNGRLLRQTPVFPSMRGCDEASLIGIANRLVVENNFGHTVTRKESQLVANEPGLAMLTITDDNSECRDQATVTTSEILWEDDRNSFFAMSMLARKSGIIFAHTADWSDDISATEGGMYYISAIDSWDGRVIWRIPLGRGYEFCHDYGGIYFNRNESNNGIFMGTRQYLVSIQDNLS